MTTRVAVIILAAGESSRFGKPKQLALFKGQTLIQRAVDYALGSGLCPVVVVLGADAETILPTVPNSVTIKTNAEWRDGMASSIRCGLSAIEDQVDAVIITLCDQPLITSDVLDQLYQAAHHGLVAAEYENTIGVPALFGREFFSALHGLKGKQGAKKVIVDNDDRVVRIPCPLAAVDIDTAEDYQRLIDGE